MLIANMASLPWDQGYSVVTVAMGCASFPGPGQGREKALEMRMDAVVDRLKASSFEGLQECSSRSYFLSSAGKGLHTQALPQQCSKAKFSFHL